jgi:O-antigen ligase
MLLMAVLIVCIFGFFLYRQSRFFRELQESLLSLQWMLLVCIAVWCCSFILLMFSRNDWPLISLLFIAIAAFFIGYATSSQEVDAVILLAGVTLGRGVKFFVGDEVTSLISKNEKIETPYVVSYFLIGLILLLAFSSWWHLDMAGSYHGPRWMGLWDNPNIYGMLMGAGVVLATGLLLADRRWKMEDGKSERSQESEVRSQKLAIGLIADNSKLKIKNSKLGWVLCIAAGMMAVGLVLSYSRGAWVGTVVGLLYLAKAHGKLKWRFVLLVVFVFAAAVVFFWHSTADTDAWYLKRLDLSRPSAQHRVSAWRGALQMMRDHPLGVGWNKAVNVYEKNYSPPEGGAAAITMNSYLMLGTELGFPGLICFVAYVALRLKRDRSWKLGVGKNAECGVRSVECVSEFRIPNSEFRIKTACRAGAVVLLVAFWFDGGLFTLATASMFWILLELGTKTVTSRSNVRVAQRAFPGGR